jgi:hypothetical protein
VEQVVNPVLVMDMVLAMVLADTAVGGEGGNNNGGSGVVSIRYLA